MIIVGPGRRARGPREGRPGRRKDIQELAPLRTEYLQVNYAKAADIAALMQTRRSGKTRCCPSRGSVAIDERTNTLLIQDTADSIANIRQLVGTLDIPVRQVLIEARIVIVNDDFSRDLGVRAGLHRHASQRHRRPVRHLAARPRATDTIARLGARQPQQHRHAVPGRRADRRGQRASRYNVNLPVANPAGSLALMLLGSDYIVDLELSAAQAEGRGEVISSPRVITANQKEAAIAQGVEIPVPGVRLQRRHDHPVQAGRAAR